MKKRYSGLALVAALLVILGAIGASSAKQLEGYDRDQAPA